MIKFFFRSQYYLTRFFFMSNVVRCLQTAIKFAMEIKTIIGFAKLLQFRMTGNFCYINKRSYHAMAKRALPPLPAVLNPSRGLIYVCIYYVIVLFSIFFTLLYIRILSISDLRLCISSNLCSMILELKTS